MPYDDATGKRVRAPVGRLTIGVGINLDDGLDEHEVDWLERHRLHVGMVAFARDAGTLSFRGRHSIDVPALPDDAQEKVESGSGAPCRRHGESLFAGCFRLVPVPQSVP